MTTTELVTLAATVAPIAAAVAGAVAALAVHYWPPARAAACVSADYVEALEAAVRAAELAAGGRLPGAAKLTFALDQVEVWLADRGIHGDARRVTFERARADIELVRARLFPSKTYPQSP